MSKKAKPFFKRASGVRASVARLDKYAHLTGYRLIEPFLGAGRFLLHRLQCSHPPSSSVPIIVGDHDANVINSWRDVRDKPDKLVRLLNEMNRALRCAQNKREWYASVRNWPAGVGLRETVRFIILMQSAYRNVPMYRVTDLKLSTSPIGHKVREVDTDNIMRVSELIQGIEFLQQDFGKTLVDAEVGPGDLIFSDPPYLGTNTAATRYKRSPIGFDEHDHVRFAAHILRAHERGALCLTTDGAEASYGANHVVQMFHYPHITNLHIHTQPRRTA